MKKFILFILIVCAAILEMQAMQQLLCITKRYKVTANKRPIKINRIAKRVARRAHFLQNCDLNGNYVSNRFVYDILRAVQREQNNNTCMLQLEKGVEDIFYLVSQMKNDIESTQCKMTDERVKSFYERLQEKKE